MHSLHSAVLCHKLTRDHLPLLLRVVRELEVLHHPICTGDLQSPHAVAHVRVDRRSTVEDRCVLLGPGVDEGRLVLRLSRHCGLRLDFGLTLGFSLRRQLR